MILPGQWVQVTDDSLSVDPTATLLGQTVLVVEPGDDEADDEITVLFAGETYYVRIEDAVVVPPPAAGEHRTGRRS
jgi:hypothetical protein